MSVKLAPTRMHVWKICTGPVLVFIFVIEISNHLCCLLHLQQTSVVVMVVTTAPDQQACILQFLLSSRDVFNGYTQPAVMMVINICSMQIYLFTRWFVDTLYSISK